jgi:hypothetical protein
MNENGQDRLRRSETVSRVVRYVVLALLILSVGNWLFSLVWWSEGAWGGQSLGRILGFLMQIVLWIWYWELAKLFHFYQRGLIFASKTIGCIRTLGILCVVNWLVVSAWRGTTYLLPSAPPPKLPAGILISVHHSPFLMGFFSFSVGGFNVGMLLAGCIIVLIAWIMEEGRKIQEDQALTV